MDLVCLNFSQFITVSLSKRESVMDSQSVVKTLKENSSHPMFNVAGTPLQDVSSTENHSTSQENAIDDAEISIFEAQKYFSEECDGSNDIKRQEQGEKPSHDLPCVQRRSSVSPVEGYGRSKSLRATPTASSEASWNSQTGLLLNSPGSTGVSLKNLASTCATRRWSAAKKWFSRRNCCCTAQKSVGVKEVTSDSEHREPIVLIDPIAMKSSNRNSNKLNTDADQRCSITDNVVEIHHIKAMPPNSLCLPSTPSSSSMDAPRQQRISATGRPFIDGFTFPILNSSTDEATSPPSLKAIVNPLENIVMDSFQPVPSLSRLSSMENHVIARGPFRPGSPIAREDDVGSDASSDLFEIESFFTQTTSCPMHCWWDSVDDNSNNARSLVSENGVQHCRRSVDEVAANECTNADGCNRVAEQMKGQRKGTGSKAAVVKCVAEGQPLIPLHVTVGGRTTRGSSPSSPLSVASMA